MRPLLLAGFTVWLSLFSTPLAGAVPLSPGERMQERSVDPKQVRQSPAFVEFQERFQARAQEPEAALKLWFDAALIVATAPTPQVRDQARAMLGSATWTFRDDPDWWQASRTRTLRDVLRNRPYTLASYCKGARPSNGYDVDPANYRLDLLVLKVDEKAARAQAVLGCSGADSPRQVTLRRDPETGLYYVEGFVGLLPQVDPPQMHGRWRP